MRRLEANEATRLPRLVDGVEIRSLPIGPEEAFLLTRIDGSTTEAELIAATGMDDAQVRETLARLAAMGAIRFETFQGSPRRRQSSHPDATPPVRRPSREVPQPTLQKPEPVVQESVTLYDEAELSEPVDLDDSRKRRILDTFYRLDGADHYELLAVPTDADKRTIKAAYFELVNLFHPDRYYGKNLGSFKTKLERVFSRLTEAYDVLIRSGPRQDYDAYLAAERRTRELDQAMSEEAHAAELESIRQQIEEQARAEPEVVVATRPASETPAHGAPSDHQRLKFEPLDPDARRRALARKLRPSQPRLSLRAEPQPTISQQVVRERATDNLRRHYEARLTMAKAQQVQRYVDVAEQALRENKLPSAANAFKIAVSLAPEDAALKERFIEVERQAVRELADNYRTQAQYEERSGRYLEAARSYERASLGQPEPKLLARAAVCLLEGAGDLRHAVELGRRAVGMAPDDAGCHLVLARVYLGVGMKTSAAAEIERAHQLAPKDVTIADWLRRARRGEL